MPYKYTPEEWEQIQRERRDEDRAQAIAYAEDMDVWSALREEQHLTDRYGFEAIRDRKGVA